MPFLDDNSKRKSYIIIKVAFHEQVPHFLRTLIFKPYIFDRLRDKSSFRSAKMNMSKKVCQVENIHFGATIWWPISQPVKGIYRVQPVKGITLKDLGPREMWDLFRKSNFDDCLTLTFWVMIQKRPKMRAKMNIF